MSQNGTVVLKAIEELQEPVTAKNVDDYLALKDDVNPDREFKETVRKTLDGGVHFGFLQKKDARYCATPLILNSAADNDDNASGTNDDALTDGQDVPEGSTQFGRSGGRQRSTNRRRSETSRQRSRSKH